MSTARFWILTSARRRAVGEAQREQLMSRSAASVDLCCIDEGADPGCPPEQMLSEWSKVRELSELTTRYNNPERVMSWLAAVARDGLGQHGVVPYVVVGCLGDAKVVVVGELGDVGAFAGLPLVSSIGPSLTRIEVAETALLVEPGPRLAELCSTVLTTMLSRGAADTVVVHNLPVGHPAADVVSRWGRLGARGASEPRVRWSARLLDRASGERVDNHSSKTRWTFRKLDRKCVEAFDGDVELETATAVDHVDAFIADSLGIIRNTYQAALPIGVKDNPEYRELLREMAEAGALRGYLLRGGGQPLAYVLGDRWGTTFSLWATAFLPDHRRLSPGIVTLRRVMDSLASEGVAVFDFGWGEAEYKKKLGDHRADETDYSLYAKRVVPMLAFAAQRGTKLARARLNQLARRLGVRDRVRAARRRLMTRP